MNLNTIRLVPFTECPNCGANVRADKITVDITNGGGFCEECKTSYINTTIKRTFNVDEAIEFVQTRPDIFDRYANYFAEVFPGRKNARRMRAVAESEGRCKLSRLFLDAIIENDAQEYFKFIERKYLEEKILIKYGVKKKSRAATQLN